MPHFKTKVTGLRSISKISNGSGGIIELPIFTMFITPFDLVKVAEVPSFKENDSHSDIAKNLQSPPTKDWQRPLNRNRVAEIGDYFGTTSQKRLMPNPILVGESRHSSNMANRTAEINVTQLTDSNGNAVTDVYQIEIINNGSYPLWILDGQHRTYGLESNDNTKYQKIPVVMLIKNDEYTMQFLAQIFTEVTTGASDLEAIHKNWMEYSFGLRNYNRGLSNNSPSAHDKAMDTILHMATIGALDGVANLFYDHIKFNPYDISNVGAYNIFWTSKDWIDVLVANYYNLSGNLMPKELAEQIIRFLRAAENLDVHKRGVSKIFGNSPQPVLINHMLAQFLQNLDLLGVKSQQQWENHLKMHEYDKADWRLIWASGSQSSNWGRYTNRASAFVWKRIFTQQKFPVTPDIALGLKATLTLHAYPKTASGKPSKKNMAHQENPDTMININGGSGPWTAGANRMLLKFTVPQSGIGSIVSLQFEDGGVPKKRDTLTIGANDTSTSILDLTDYTSPMDIEITTCSFNEASKKIDSFKIQW